MSNDIVHARCTCDDNSVDIVKILLEEIGTDLFHEHGRLAGLDFSNAIGSIENFERLIDCSDEARLGNSVDKFLDFGFHVGGSRGN